MNKQGDKKVPLGWLPTQLEDLATFKSGGTPNKQNLEFWDGVHPWVSAKDLKTHFLITSEDRLTDEGIANANIAPAGSSLILVRGMTLLKDFPVGYATRPLAFNQDLKALIPNVSVDGLFLSYLLFANKQKIRQLVNTAGHGTGRIDTDEIKAFPVNLPNKNEQIKIAQILSTWDKAITQTQQLIEAKQSYSTWLIEKLINPPNKSHWHFSKLGDLLTESRIPGKTGADAKKITVKLYGKGVIPKSENRAGSENTKFYIRKSGQFIYSKLDFLNGAFGIIPPELDGYESTLDLPAFDISPDASGEWLLYFFNRPSFYESQQNLAKGQRKARRINPSDLFELEIQLPPNETQLKSVAILNACKSEIGFLKRKVECLQTQKQGLMQKLLTGQIRVKVGN